NIVTLYGDSEPIGEDEGRKKLSFNANWKFIKQDVEGAQDPQYDDSEWVTVSTPHTFNDVDTFDKFMEGGHNGERSMYTGKTWYRKHFTIDEKDKNKKVFIEFEAARQAADVYINGSKLEGKSENGFIPFGYDLTPYLNYGNKENVLAVMVDNSFPYKAEGTDDVLSWHDSHWHPTHGGLYRNVYMTITDKLHVTLPLYSFLKTQGTYVYASNITKDAADVTVDAEVYNEYDSAKTVEYVVEIVDREGNIVLTMNDIKELASGEKSIFSHTATLANPHRWSPDYPYLYKVVTKLKMDNKIVDEYDTTLGVRTFEFTNDQGFFINGNHLKLQGWGQKATNEWAGLGAAYPDWMHDYVLKMMKDAGGNFIRWGHVAGSPTQISVSDKYGILTLQPGVDGEGSTVGGVYSDTAYEVRSDAFRDMIIYYRNHPSIISWEGGNQSVPEKEAQTLKALVQEWDPHGERNYAHRRSDNTMGKYIDVSIGTEGSWELKNLGLPVVEGEFNREEAARRVWD
ncbi:sugar-binding domain-containing protein, partial [Neobacillus niacini]|uniref:glycoside hydrolase family 2 protein n=1 Tax=Neobacillus niacini TaxID=86668 RepID=UPI0030034BCC